MRDHEFAFVARHPEGWYVLGLARNQFFGTYDKAEALRLAGAGFTSIAKMLPVERVAFREPQPPHIGHYREDA